MTLDLSNPVVIGVSITVISAIILGTYHYVKTLVQLNFTDKKLSNVLSELDTLHQNYKKEITDINKRSEKELTNTVNDIFSLYDKKIAIILKQYAPPKVHSFELPPQQDNLLVEAKPSLPSFPGPKIPDKTSEDFDAALARLKKLSEPTKPASASSEPGPDDYHAKRRSFFRSDNDRPKRK